MNFFKKVVLLLCAVGALSTVGCGRGHYVVVSYEDPYYDPFYDPWDDTFDDCDFYDYDYCYDYVDPYDPWDGYDDGWRLGKPGSVVNDDSEFLSRDTLAEGAIREEEAIERAGKRLASRFAGLSEESGVKIARTLQGWETLSKKQKRKRTEADLRSFTKQIFGVDADLAANALNQALQGDLSEAIDLNEEVAAHWNTSPETSKAILTTWFKKQIADSGN